MNNFASHCPYNVSPKPKCKTGAQGARRVVNGVAG